MKRGHSNKEIEFVQRWISRIEPHNEICGSTLSKNKFERQLHESRRLSANDVAKLGRISYVAIDRFGAEELCIIE